MKTLLIMIMLTVAAHAQTDLTALRQRVAASVHNEESLNMIIADLHGARQPVVAGYRALSLLLLARLQFNPVSKLLFFTRGRNELEGAIRLDPVSPELRLLRLSVQRELPAILDYSGSIADDISFIQTKFGAIQDEDLRSRIRRYFSENLFHLKLPGND